jgi:hypothetical protein
MEAKMDAMNSKLEAHHEGMRANVNTRWEETTTCQEATEAYPEMMDANPEETKEEAAAKPVRALKKRHRGRNLAVGRRGKPKERTQGNGGCQKELVSAQMKDDPACTSGTDTAWTLA